MAAPPSRAHSPWNHVPQRDRCRPHLQVGRLRACHLPGRRLTPGTPPSRTRGSPRGATCAAVDDPGKPVQLAVREVLYLNPGYVVRRRAGEAVDPRCGEDEGSALGGLFFSFLSLFVLVNPG